MSLSLPCSVGVTPVTYVVTDSSGNNYSCTFTVTVTDVQSPTVTCPANASVFTDLSPTPLPHSLWISDGPKKHVQSPV